MGCPKIWGKVTLPKSCVEQMRLATLTPPLLRRGGGSDAWGGVGGGVKHHTGRRGEPYLRFGCGVVLRYGLTSVKPLGKSVAASSLLTAGTMMQSLPCSQFAGVATL